MSSYKITNYNGKVLKAIKQILGANKDILMKNILRLHTKLEINLLTLWNCLTTACGQ